MLTLTLCGCVDGSVRGGDGGRAHEPASDADDVDPLADGETSESDGATSDAGSTELESDAGVDVDAGSAGSADAGPDALIDPCPLSQRAGLEAGSGVLSIRMLHQGKPLAGAAVTFSYEGGGCYKQNTDEDGWVRSDDAPSRVTLDFPSWLGVSVASSTLEGGSYSPRVVILAPALGDAIVVVNPGETGQGHGLTTAGFDVSGSPWLAGDAGAPTATALTAGADCMRLTLKDAPPPQQGSWQKGCAVGDGEALLAVARDDAGAAKSFAEATLSSTALDGGTLFHAQLSPWVTPEPLAWSLSGAPVAAQASLWWERHDAAAWLGSAEQPHGGAAAPFAVPRSLADGFVLEARTLQAETPAGSTTQWTRVRSAPAVTGIDLAFEPGMPAVSSLNSQDTALGPRAWSLADPAAEARADAVVVRIKEISKVSLCCGFMRDHVIIGPPGAYVSTQVSTLDPSVPGTSIVGSVFSELKSIAYYDHDQRQGYREFLKEPLLLDIGAGPTEMSAGVRPDASRGALVRASVFVPAPPERIP